MVVLKKDAQMGNRVISASRKRLCGSTSTHVHEFFEIEYVINGSGTCLVDGQAHEMAAGTLFLLNPANTHAIRDAKAEIINVMFNCECDTPAFSLPVLYAPATPLFRIAEADRPLILSLLLELVQVHVQNTDYARTLLACVIQKLASLPAAVSKEPLPYIRHALLYITEHFRNGITLESTAAHLGLSATYLSELFAQQTGMNFKAYLDRIRFSHAQNLLAFTNVAVCEVPERSGFGDYANFSRRFHRLYGVTPGEYRKKHQTV